MAIGYPAPKPSRYTHQRNVYEQVSLGAARHRNYGSIAGSIQKRAVCNIRGEVHPIKAFRKAWLIQNGDTVPVKRMGSRFQVAVKPGEYGIWIDAIAPYKDQVFREITLTDDQVSDLGEIDLFE